MDTPELECFEHRAGRDSLGPQHHAPRYGRQLRQTALAGQTPLEKQLGCFFPAFVFLGQFSPDLSDPQ